MAGVEQDGEQIGGANIEAWQGKSEYEVRYKIVRSVVLAVMSLTEGRTPIGDLHGFIADLTGIERQDVQKTLVKMAYGPDAREILWDAETGYVIDPTNEAATTIGRAEALRLGGQVLEREKLADWVGRWLAVEDEQGRLKEEMGQYRQEFYW